MSTVGQRADPRRAAPQTPGEWVPGVAVLLLIVVVTLAAGPTAARELSRDAVKAGFLFNFAQFASWPDGRVTQRDVTVCVERGKIDEAVFVGWEGIAGTNYRLRPRFVGRPPGPEDLLLCDVLFTGMPDAAAGVPGLVEAARRDRVLLVSDAPGFAASGGHIELFLDGNLFRFRVNLAELRRSGVELSSKVLRLAVIVQSDPTR